MRHFDWGWLVVSSVLLAALARAETRPQYGGTLHVAMRAAPVSLDPADNTLADSFARRSLTMLMFDTLVTTDDSGRVRPSLAASWQSTSSNHGWQFRLRHGIRFHDGTPLTPEIAAASLRAANPSWNMSADADSITIEGTGSELLAELALPRNAIAKRGDNGRPSGTGPFHIADWLAGKKLTLAAEEGCWRGRPFVDSIEIEMGRSFRDQMTALELGKADLVEVEPEQSHRAALEGRLLANSLPMELMALVFSRDAKSADEKMLREALALSVERGSIRSVLLQGAGLPAGSVLPTWMSGYGFVFPAAADLPRARHTREQVRTVPTWTVAYDVSDPVARLLTERIALNARDAGLSLQPTTAATADLRLARIPLASPDPWIALADVAAVAGAAAKDRSGSVESLYAAEQSLLITQRFIPLFHLSASNAASSTLKNWTLRSDGTWNLAEAWLESGKP
jgi:ABC-type transport system substrate-binding protein